jgi:hypothetical protein
MKIHKKRLNLVGPIGRGLRRSLVLGLLMASFWTSGASWASKSRDLPDPGQEQRQTQDQGQTQEQLQGQTQGQDTTVITSATAGIEAGAVNVTNVREAQGDYEVKFRNNPNVYTNPPAPTIPCYKTGGAGASGGGLGISLGGGKVDEECVKRENIRLGDAIGMTTQARFAWCNLDNNLAIFESVGECLTANTSAVSPEYQLLLHEKNRIERELRETQTVIAARCAKAEQSNERLEEAWLECIAK